MWSSDILFLLCLRFQGICVPVVFVFQPQKDAVSPQGGSLKYLRPQLHHCHRVLTFTAPFFATLPPRQVQPTWQELRQLVSRFPWGFLLHLGGYVYIYILISFIMFNDYIYTPLMTHRHQLPLKKSGCNLLTNKGWKW